MSWFRLDDKSWSHSKIVVAGNAAWGALCRMGAYASDHLTDGIIPSSIAQLIATIDEIERLVETGLLVRRAGGDYEIHDYLRYNPRARDVRKLREVRASAGRSGARQTNGKRVGKSPASADHVAEPLPCDVDGNRSPRPDPDPDPDPKERKKIQDSPDAKPSGSDPARMVFRYYVEQRAFHLGARSTSQPTTKRLKLVRDRLAEGFTVDDLKRAVDGLFATPWNMGENDRHTKYVEPEHVFREAAQVERHRATAEERAGHVAPPASTATEPDEPRGPQYAPPGALEELAALGMSFPVQPGADVRWTPKQKEPA